MNRITAITNKISHLPACAHIMLAVERFNDRMGSQFGAAITYFSFLSLIPILMVLFAAAGFVLASNEALLTDLIDKLVAGVSDPSLGKTLEQTVQTAVNQRTAVGLSGLNTGSKKNLSGRPFGRSATNFVRA